MSEKLFIEFYNIVKKLRKECPWDKIQTNDSIKDATIEEAYEVVEAIENKNDEDLKKELGDLLLHAVFHSAIAEDEGRFTFSEVVESEMNKLISRHPHVFKKTDIAGAEAVKTNWEKLKLQEGRTSILEGVPRSLPSLQRAYRIQEKASKIGFDWKEAEHVWNKVQEELCELRVEIAKGEKADIEEEMGDLLFSIVNYSRFIGVHPETALRKSIDKFISRFNYIEKQILEKGGSISESSLEEMDKYWEESKKYYS